MTQQPYPPQYPGYPGAAPQQFQQPYAPQPYPGQQFQQPYPPQAPQQPAVPLAKGTLDDYYNQPSAGSGPSISWSNPDQSQKPIGTTYAGFVARPVTNADIQQQTDPKTQQPKFFRDGRPMFVMTVPLKVQPSAEFPDGQATWFVRGQARDELVRAMAEAGAPAGPPEHNAYVVVTLVQRRPSRMGNAANIVQVKYTRPQGAQQGSQAAPAGPNVEQNGQQGTVATSPAPAAPAGPAPQVQHQQYPPADPYYVPPAQVIDNYPNQPQAQTVPQGPAPQQPAPQSYAQYPPAQGMVAPQPAAPQPNHQPNPQPSAQPNPQQFTQQVPPAQQPVGTDLTPEQQELFARLSGAQAQQAQQVQPQAQNG